CFHTYRAHPDLTSFPTRRSSDLIWVKTLPKATVKILEENSYSRSRVTLQASSRRGWKRQWPSKCLKGPSTRRISTSLPGSMRLRDRKSTRLNSSHVKISYAVFCL